MNALDREPPLGLPNPEPLVPEDVPGELLTDRNGKYFIRNELSDRWVSYRYFDQDGELRRGVTFPRFQMISDEVIAQIDAESAAEEAQQA